RAVSAYASPRARISARRGWQPRRGGPRRGCRAQGPRPREASRLQPHSSMWRRSPAARAVFHDRMAMEEAVRALELEGVNRRHISVSRADASGGGVRRPPETGSALSIAGAVGSEIGAALALSSFDWTGRGLPLSV